MSENGDPRRTEPSTTRSASKAAGIAIISVTL
jgi:hypothetical protein